MLLVLNPSLNRKALLAPLHPQLFLNLYVSPVDTSDVRVNFLYVTRAQEHLRRWSFGTWPPVGDHPKKSPSAHTWCGVLTQDQASQRGRHALPGAVFCLPRFGFTCCSAVGPFFLTRLPQRFVQGTQSRTSSLHLARTHSSCAHQQPLFQTHCDHSNNNNMSQRSAVPCVLDPVSVRSLWFSSHAKCNTGLRLVLR